MHHSFLAAVPSQTPKSDLDKKISSGSVHELNEFVGTVNG